MKRLAHSTLSEEVEGALSNFGTALANGTVSPVQIDQVVRALASLQPSAAIYLESVIAGRARLVRWYHYTQAEITGTRGHDIRRLSKTPELAPIFIFHRDGFLREASLDYLKDLPDSPFFLASLIWRLNDWVPNVRAAALACAKRLLPSVSAQAIVEIAPILLLRCPYWTRWGEEEAAVARAQMARPDVIAALTSLFLNGRAGPIPTMLRSALREPAFDTRLFELAFHALQPGVRAIALQALLAKRVSWRTGSERQWIDRVYNNFRTVPTFTHREIDHAYSLNILIGEGLKDRSAIVRRVAADSLMERLESYPSVAEAVAVLNADPSPSIRERGAFIAKQFTRIADR